MNTTTHLKESVFNTLKDKVILITGGTGSFGRCLVRLILQKASPEKVIIFSRDEWKHWEMQNEDPLFNHPKLRYFLGDIRDKDRLLRAFNEVDIVIHAAALKQVPFAEYNPSEYVKTNVLGAMNIIDAAIACRVEKIIGISTDKAVNPVNLYGSTKLCSDKLLIAGNAYVGKKQKTQFSVVRYGNVIGSKGSVVPFFMKLKQQKVDSLPITDERMTRFWITLDGAVEFVLKSLNWMDGGEIFVPKIPSMNIIDLAQAIAPEIPRRHCGIRPGEKLHEVLIGKDDAYTTWEFDDHFVVYPPSVHQSSGKERFKHLSEGKLVSEGFCFSSDENVEHLDVKTLQAYLNNL